SGEYKVMQPESPQSSSNKVIDYGRPDPRTMPGMAVRVVAVVASVFFGTVACLLWVQDRGYADHPWTRSIVASALASVFFAVAAAGLVRLRRRHGGGA